MSKHEFAFNPDTGPPRLIRYVNDLPPEVVAAFDAENNLLRVNKEVFDALSSFTKSRVLRTRSCYLLFEPGAESETLELEDYPVR